MDPIYVTGHRNPDTDSIVAAMAYTALRNALGHREYEAACLGHVSDETQIVLNRFGFKPPKLLTGIYTQVKDLDYDKPPILSAAVTVDRGWNKLGEQKNTTAVPVANEDGTLFGMLSREDVASYNMAQVAAGVLEKVPLFNVLSVLEGKLLNDAGEDIDTVEGEVTIALPQSRENLLFNNPDSIVLCGHQPDMIRRALNMNVNCPRKPASFPRPTTPTAPPGVFSSPPPSAGSAGRRSWCASIWRTGSTTSGSRCSSTGSIATPFWTRTRRSWAC